MTIPIRNLYWLLCYAWDVLDEAEAVDLGDTEPVTFQDLMASVLVSGIQHVARRGLDRDYIGITEETPRVRGRIGLSQTACRLLEIKSQAYVEFDELSSDIPANQILKAAARALLRTEGISKENRSSLASICHSLPEVSDQRLSGALFRRVRIHRNNRSYGFLMQICLLIFENLIPDSKGDGAHFRDFVQDEGRMRELFQKFVFNFYVREQRTHRVRADQIRWQDSHVVRPGPGGLPLLCTDVTLSNESEILVIDTKFTARSLESNMGGDPKLRTEHLYQIWAYVTNFAAREHGQRSIRGLLLYPSTSSTYHSEWAIQGHRVGITGINMDQDWLDIRRELIEVLSPS